MLILLDIAVVIVIGGRKDIADYHCRNQRRAAWFTDVMLIQGTLDLALAATGYNSSSFGSELAFSSFLG